MSVGEPERRPPSLRKCLRFDEIVRADCKTQSNFFKLCLRPHASCCIIHTEITCALHLPVHCLLESIMQQFEEMSPSGTECSAWHISLLLSTTVIHLLLAQNVFQFSQFINVYWPYQLKNKLIKQSTKPLSHDFTTLHI